MIEQHEQKLNIEKLPIPFQSVFKDYLSAAEQTEEWLNKFPKEMEWMLKISPTKILEEAAKSLDKKFTPTREEETPTFGELILELVARRYTGLDALQNKEQKWGSGWNHWNEQTKQIAFSSIENLVKASKESSRELFNMLLNISPEEVIKQNVGGNEVEYNPIQIVQQITKHEKRHKGMFDFFDDMLSEPEDTKNPSIQEEFYKIKNEWFTEFPKEMEWILDFRLAKILELASTNLNMQFVPKIKKKTDPIGKTMMERLEKEPNEQTNDYFRCVFDLIRAPFPPTYNLAKTTRATSSVKA